MTTIRRPHHPKRRQGLSKCAMLGLSIVALIILHLLAVAFLYQRVPADTTHSLRRQGMDTVLKRSRDSLKKAEAPKKQQTMKRMNKFMKEKTLQKEQESPRESRDKKQEAKSRPHGDADSRDKKKAKDSPPEEKEDKEIPDKAKEKIEGDVNEGDKAGAVGGKADDGKADVVEEDNKPPGDSAEVEEQGTRVTDKAYISDFVFERNHPHFRTQELVFPELDKRVESLESCGYIANHRLLTHAACRDVDTLLTAFNSQPFPRSWCGKVIAPNSVERFDEPCHEPVRLFPMDAPVSGEGMPPITITANKGSTNLEQVSCDVPCQQQVGMEGKTRFIEGTDWEITTTGIEPSTKIEPSAYRNNQYYSTTSFSSSIPLSPFSFDNYNLTVDAVAFDDTLNSASYLIDNACSSPGSKRHRWVGAVEKHFPVAYYGSCTHNTDLPEGMSLKNRDDRVQLHKKHRFNLAFESSNEKDYLTQVIFDAFQSGSLPVILGPSNIESHFPPNSFINAGRFQYWDQLGQYVKEVSENKTLWESYHEWRKDPDALKSFRERFSFTKMEPTCRMCRWAYAKQYGLGWNHVQQVVQDTGIPRELCIDSELVTKPFVESYMTKSGDTYQEVAAGVKDSQACEKDGSSLHAAFDLNEFRVERTVQNHDGVTDLTFDHISRPNAGGDIVLRLEFGMGNTGGASFRNPHTLVSTIHGPVCSSIALQDGRSKVTVVANWETEITSTADGTIEVVANSVNEGSIQEDETRRIRIIVEDMSYIHDKLTEYYPSSYGKLMIQDFVDPLEFLYNTN